MLPSWLFGWCELLLVSLMWGCTNPALNRASKERAPKAEQAAPTMAAASPATVEPAQPSPSILSLLLNYQFVAPFVVNQLGSVLYLHCLSHLAVSFAVPTVNALTMILTAVTGYAMGEKQVINKRVVLGMTLILCGVTMCILGQHWQEEAAQHTAVRIQASPKLLVVAPPMSDSLPAA